MDEASFSAARSSSPVYFSKVLQSSAWRAYKNFDSLQMKMAEAHT